MPSFSLSKHLNLPIFAPMFSSAVEEDEHGTSQQHEPQTLSTRPPVLTNSPVGKNVFLAVNVLKMRVGIILPCNTEAGMS